MNIILFDTKQRINLLPLTFTRPMGELRVGILTAAERWKHLTQATISYKTQPYLSTLFPIQLSADNWFINGGVIADTELAKEITALTIGEALYSNDSLIAARLNQADGEGFDANTFTPANKREFYGALEIKATHDVFMLNDKALRSDFKLLTEGRKSKVISDTNRVIAPENIFIEESATVECANLNASTGHIYIGPDAEVMEGSSIRGPFALCDHSQLKLNTKIYGPTTVGPHSKVGGEVTRSVIMGYSNKGHDGFLGDSVLGYWCNLGADTNNSNLKKQLRRGETVGLRKQTL